MYRIGYCPCCDVQIMTQDSNGKWNGFKYNFRQADLTYDDGHRMRTIICEKCFQEPDIAKIIDSITAEGTQACSKEKAREIKSWGLPVSINLANAKQGKKLGGN